MHNSALLLLVLIVFCGRFSVNRNFLQRCETLAAKRPKHLLDGLHDFVGDEDEQETLISSDKQVWTASKGLRGAWDRWIATTVDVRIMQAFRRENRVTREQAQNVYMDAIFQTWYTFWTIPEAFLCTIIPSMPHACARYALSFHARVAYSTVDFTYTQQTPLCILKLKDSL